MGKSKTSKRPFKKSGKIDRRSKLAKGEHGLFASFFELIVEVLFSLIGLIITKIIPALFFAIFVEIPKIVWKSLKYLIDIVTSKTAKKASKD